ncbi:MAG: 16S rRNA methyltransferase [Thermoprotei archaeon]|nr:MAG: 16S rRNA methyltransferase [Thermoprotei archaeon]
MEKLYLLFAEAGLELIPREIRRHPAVRASAERRKKRLGEILLDISLHYQAAKKLKDFRKRGRPDIVHFCLLMALGSPLCKVGKLLPIVHTYRNDIIWVNPEVRLPRNYNRFVGLIEQLFLTGKVPPKSDQPLLSIIGHDLNEIIESYKPSQVFLLSEKGEKFSPLSFARKVVQYAKPMVIIGAFQAGDFSDEVKNIADREVSISKYVLDAWVATAELICAVESVIGIHGDKVEN